MSLTMECIHAAERRGGVIRCGLDLFGGMPHVNVCLRSCPVRDRPDAKVLLVAGIMADHPSARVAVALGRKPCRRNRQASPELTRNAEMIGGEHESDL
jgi:hypothetical protein